MTTAPGDLAILFARLEVKLDQLIDASGDHEARIRRLEDRTPGVGKGTHWAVVLANAIMTAITTVAAGSTVIGG
ncbi:hypothetical protein ABZ208_37510 [Streptomyces sp. NPDC006208]|uniref:hypothetical protein n=1 Tax=Streptomyces sp. NPDC006208 TaxID=3156734 RepID=UPI0033B21906